MNEQVEATEVEASTTGIDALKNPKYAGKYKGSAVDRGDDLRAWIDDQITVNGEDGDYLDLDKLFELLENNNAKEGFIEKRQQWIADAVHGHVGRILMDSRNHLKGLARKSERVDQLKGINGRWSGDAFTLPPKQKTPAQLKKEASEEAA